MVETVSGRCDQKALLSISDALAKPCAAHIGGFEANSDHWGVLVDYMMTVTGFDKPTSGPVSDDLDAFVKTQVLAVCGTYRLPDTGSAKVDWRALTRWFGKDIKPSMTRANSGEKSKILCNGNSRKAAVRLFSRRKRF